MGGRSPAQIVSTAVTAVTTPVVGLVATAREVIGAEKVDSAPVVGTVTAGVTAQGNIAGTTVDAAGSGDFSAVRKEGVDLAKYGAVVGAAYAGASFIGAEAAVPAATLGDGIAKRGVDVGTLAGAAASYFGNDLASYGIDVNKLFPKQPAQGAYDKGGSGAGYFQTPKTDFGTENTGAGVTLGLGIAALVIFILVMRRKK